MMLDARGVACRRGHRLLFEDISFVLAPGAALVVTGPNGVGKSSLLRIAAGLLRPFAGRVERGGAVAWLGEAMALDGDRPLIDALRFWAGLDGAAPEHAMAAMDIAHLGPVPIRYLSTGQRRRAAVARTIASAAPLWVLDEPANGLDAEGVERLGAAIAGHRAAGGAVLAATHLPLAIERADQLSLFPRAGGGTEAASAAPEALGSRLRGGTK